MRQTSLTQARRWLYAQLKDGQKHGARRLMRLAQRVGIAPYTLHLAYRALNVKTSMEVAPGDKLIWAWRLGKCGHPATAPRKGLRKEGTPLKTKERRSHTYAL